jgi:hypothetical protein
VRPYTSRADALDQIAALNGTAFDYGFWGDEFFATARPAVASIAAGHRFLIDGEQAGVEVDIHEDPENYCDFVRVMYTTRFDGDHWPSGSIAQTIRPAGGIWFDAEPRVSVLDLSGVVLDESAAQAAGDQYLQWAAANLEQGTITVRVPYLQQFGGGFRIAAYARAGDWVGVAQIPAHYAAPLLVTGVDVEADSGTVVLTVGEARGEFVSRLSKAGRVPADLYRPARSRHHRRRR